MKNAVFRGILKVVLISLLICSIFLIYFLSKSLFKQTERNMAYTLPIIDYSIDYSEDIKSQIDLINPLILDSDTRITIIKTDGTVAADTSSEIDYSDNHLSREEVKAALKNKIGINVRYSETLQKNMLYAAYLSAGGDYIIRLSAPYTGILSYAGIIIGSVVISIIISFIIAFFIARQLSKSITEPLSEISAELSKIQNDGEKPEFGEYKYDEINYIAKTAEILSERIDKTVENLEFEKNKIDYIIDNMNEGLVIVDENNDVVTINKTALSVFGAKKRKPNKNIVNYTQNIEILNSIKKAFDTGKESLFDIEKADKTYALHITKTKKGIFDKKMKGVIILLIDVTLARETQKIRQDFFSDASHELKTPITSIQGYAELLTSGIEYTDERKAEFLKRIQTEAQNMSVLINDILMISRLEAGMDAENPSIVNVGNIIEEVIQLNEPMIKKNNLKTSVSCSDDISFNMDYNKIYQLIDNLVSNAVRYNKPNGEVNIKAEIKENQFLFSIKDTGIGIPFNSQQRVFERFYRADKGRSRKIGGTGLGLAIVKHIVSFYSGSVNLKSVPDEGTEISVSLPLPK